MKLRNPEVFPEKYRNINDLEAVFRSVVDERIEDLKDADRPVNGSGQEPDKTLVRECGETLDQFLMLSDGAFKRLAYDAYSAQLASARSYTWIALVLMGANFGLLQLAGSHPECSMRWIQLVVQLPAVLYAFMAFYCATMVGHGTDKGEPFTRTVEIFEGGPLTDFECYETKKGALAYVNELTKDESALIGRRGSLLRACGGDIRVSAIWTVVSSMFYFALFF